MYTVYEWDTFEIKCIVLYHVSQPFWNLRKLQPFTVWSFPAGKPTLRCHHGWENLLEMEVLMGTCSFIMRIYRHVWLQERTWEIFTEFWQIKRHARITRLVEGKIYTMLSPNRGLSCKYSLKVMRKKPSFFCVQGRSSEVIMTRCRRLNWLVLNVGVRSMACFFLFNHICGFP